MVSKSSVKPGILGVVAALVVTPLLTSAMTAQAAPVPETLLSCAMSGKATFSPALSLNPSGQRTKLKVDGNATRCRSRSGVEVTSAQFSGSMTGRMSCTSPPRNVDGDVRITWTHADGSTGQSTARFVLDLKGDLSDPSKPITGNFTGESTEGEFKGNKHTGRGRVDSAGVARGCFTGGLESLKFNGSYAMSR